MYSIKVEYDLLICFSQKQSNNSLVVYSIKIPASEYYSSIELEINEIYTFINSITSSDNKKAFDCCYLKNENKVICRVYNIETNKWEKESIFLANCQINNHNN